MRFRIPHLVFAAIVIAAVPFAVTAEASTQQSLTPASSGVPRGPGFTMPSRLVQCAALSKGSSSWPFRKGLYCSARYIKKRAYDGLGVVYLPPSGRARIVGSGNDILLMIGADKRPTLRYGANWRHGGYRCVSKRTGVECRRGSHGFRLSREATRLY